MTVEYIINPDIKMIEEIDEEMYCQHSWSRVRRTIEISYEALDSFTAILALDTEKNRPVGLITLAKDYSVEGRDEDALWYVGSFYVSAESRLKGIGKALGARAMSYVQQTNATMNGTLELVEQYKASGFPLMRDFKNAFATIETKNIHLGSAPEQSGFSVKNFDEVDFKLIEAYDQGISGRHRSKYLNLWMTRPEGGVTKIALNGTGKVVGFIVVNQQYVNRLITGPFYADSVEIAQSLLHTALLKFELTKYERVIFKFPEPNERVRKILETITTEPIVISANGLCMFSKKALLVDPSKIFGFTETAHSFV